MSPTTTGTLFTILIAIGVALFTNHLMNEKLSAEQDEITPFKKYQKPNENRTLATWGAVFMIAAIVELFLFTAIGK